MNMVRLIFFTVLILFVNAFGMAFVRNADASEATKIKDVNYGEMADALTKRNQDKERRRRISKITDPSELAQEIIAYELDLKRRVVDNFGIPRQAEKLSFSDWARKRDAERGNAAAMVMDSIKDDPGKIAGVLNTAKVFSALSGYVPGFSMMKQFQSDFEKEIIRWHNQEILKNTPRLALWLRNPEFAGLAKDDLANLGWFEGVWKRITGNNFLILLVLVMVIACFLVTWWAAQWIWSKTRIGTKRQGSGIRQAEDVD